MASCQLVLLRLHTAGHDSSTALAAGEIKKLNSMLPASHQMPSNFRTCWIRSHACAAIRPCLPHLCYRWRVRLVTDAEFQGLSDCGKNASCQASFWDASRSTGSAVSVRAVNSVSGSTAAGEGLSRSAGEEGQTFDASRLHCGPNNTVPFAIFCAVAR